jgi:NAD(P)-dependent dehydrogenase (short-subunit alcohol dehydrogenase family)
MSYDVRDKTILVTGANRGIGKAITNTLLKHGAGKIYAAVRRAASADSLVESHGDKIVPLQFDLTKPNTIKAAADTASDVTLVINNAGVLRVATAFSDDAIDALKFEMEANVYGLIHIAQAFAPVLKANGGGALVQLNSVVSMKCFPQFTTYCASKAAAYSLTQGLRAQLSEQGTAVVSVHPGPIATDMGDAAGLSEIAEPPELVGEAIVAALKVGDFHVFPDSMAKQIGEAYQSFAENVVEADLTEG